uniref:Tudor domain-containing protein n=1 Tax=Pyxicephalus adspersus TaxID=30357 RepID=A0AAV3AS86_PYXAD|nr:TPA: hypothetical protein GDO54_010056 [Pyxicephalus adspersus]
MAVSAGAVLRLRVCRVEARAEVPVVKLWGSLNEQFDQQPTPALCEEEWRPQLGELCLAEVGGHWLRSKVLLQRGADYQVFVLDKGAAISVSPSRLRQGPAASFFPLPPHLLVCAISNLVPPKGQYWNYSALNYFYSLQGQEVRGQVRNLIPHQGLVLLDVQEITQNIILQGLARVIPDQSFCALLGSSSANHCQPLLSANGTDPCQLAAMDFYNYPRLQNGLTEAVMVTQVTDPHSIFCQLSRMSRDVQFLTDAMQRFYDMQSGFSELSYQPPFVLGQPCASRGVDGRWYRSLLQDIFTEKQLAMVILVDWGRRDIVPLNCLRPLAAEFFRLPVISFHCALYGITDGGMGWEQALIVELRSLLQGRQIDAKIEFYNTYEHLYVVTLLAADGLNLNRFFGMRAENLKRSGSDTPVTTVSPLSPIGNGEKMDTPKLHEESLYVPKLSTVDLKTGTFYDAMVEFIINPSHFWVRIEEDCVRHKEMVHVITTMYSKASKLDGIITKPKPGIICCAKFKDDMYYRAEIVSIEKKQVKVFFLDHGNMEMVDWYNVRELPAEFKSLPAMVNKCCLVDIRPLRETWSPEAILAFKVAVVDKKLVIHVISKNLDKYTIEVFDQSRVEESNIGKVLSSDGFAKYEELEAGPVVQTGRANGIHTTPSLPAFNAGSTRTGQQEVNVELPNEDGILYSPYEDQVFEPGTTIEVIVSHVENPGLFWCQNATQSSVLNNMMDLIQAHCSSTDTAPERNALACFAQSPQNGIWYRGFIAEVPEGNLSNFVEVLYVDYGKKETVPLVNLRAMKNKFFHVKSQAFKCSLYNMIAPVSNNPFHWDSKATEAFLDFAQQASKGNEFHCMFFASALLDKELFNIVDLYTPFDSICSHLVNRGFATHLSHKTLAPSVQLQTFYYSLHEIKTGSEEEVLVTHVNPSLEFYCQLIRNTSTVEWIAEAIVEACRKTQHLKLLCSGPLCLGKFADEQWYRGFICSENKEKEIFFVDFGNTEKVTEDDLRPIMHNEHNLLLLPMQAIKCSLPDVPSKVPKEIVTWFEDTVLEKNLRAVIVAKEADGKLLVELYDGKEKINTTLKNKLGIKAPKSQTGQNFKQYETKPASFKPLGEDKRSRESFQRQSLQTNSFNDPNNADMSTGLKKHDRSYPETSFEHQPYNAKYQESSQNNNTLAFRSSCQDGATNQDSSSVENDLVDQISNTINKDQITFEVLSEKDINVGDVVCAFFDGDKLYHRGVVIEKTALALNVQYLDYGNTSMVSNHKTYRLPEKLCSIPAQCIHCSLKGADSVPSDKNIWKNFYERTSDQQLDCEFVKSEDGKWDVVLYDKQGCINDLLISLCGRPLEAENGKATAEGILRQQDVSHKSFIWNLPQTGQSVKVFASSVDGPDYFWCQLSTAEVDSLAKQIQEAGVKSIQDDYFIATIEVGSPCNVMYSQDNNWYRAIITKMEADIATVRFIDYGNMESVAKNQIRQLPKAFIIIPAQAFPCCLVGFNMGAGSWTSEGNDYFYQQITEDILTLTIEEIKHDEKSNIPLALVRLNNNDLDMNEEMKRFWQPESASGKQEKGTLEKQLVREDVDQPIPGVEEANHNMAPNTVAELPGEWDGTKYVAFLQSFTWNLPQIGDTLNVFVSSVDSPDYFWCQLTTMDIDSLARLVQEAGNKSVRDDYFIATIEVGSPCNVMYSQDNNWYRGIITTMEADVATVRFIDYGDMENVDKDKIRQLPNALIRIPVQAFPCCLAGFYVGAGTWTSEGEDYFYRNVTEDLMELTIEEIQNEEMCKIPLACVRMKYKELDINQEMKCFWQPGQNQFSVLADSATRKQDSTEGGQTLQEKELEMENSKDVLNTEKKEDKKDCKLPRNFSQSSDEEGFDVSLVDPFAMDYLQEVEPSFDKGMRKEDGDQDIEHLGKYNPADEKRMEEVGDVIESGGLFVSNRSSLEYKDHGFEKTSTYTCLMESQELVIVGDSVVHVVASGFIADSSDDGDITFASSVEAVVGEADENEEEVCFADSVEALHVSDTDGCTDLEAIAYMDCVEHIEVGEHESFLDSIEHVDIRDTGEHFRLESTCDSVEAVATGNIECGEVEAITYLDSLEATAVEDIGECAGVEAVTHMGSLDAVAFGDIGECEGVEAITYVDCGEAITFGDIECEEVEAITYIDNVAIGDIGECVEVESFTYVDGVEAAVIGDIGEYEEVEAFTYVDSAEASPFLDIGECEIAYMGMKSASVSDNNESEGVVDVTNVDHPYHVSVNDMECIKAKAIAHVDIGESEEVQTCTFMDGEKAVASNLGEEGKVIMYVDSTQAASIGDIGEFKEVQDFHYVGSGEAVVVGDSSEGEEAETVPYLGIVEAAAVYDFDESEDSGVKAMEHVAAPSKVFETPEELINDNKELINDNSSQLEDGAAEKIIVESEEIKDEGIPCSKGALVDSVLENKEVFAGEDYETSEDPHEHEETLDSGDVSMSAKKLEQVWESEIDVMNEDLIKNMFFESTRDVALRCSEQQLQEQGEQPYILIAHEDQPALITNPEVSHESDSSHPLADQKSADKEDTNPAEYCMLADQPLLIACTENENEGDLGDTFEDVDDKGIEDEQPQIFSVCRDQPVVKTNPELMQGDCSGSLADQRTTDEEDTKRTEPCCVYTDQPLVITSSENKNEDDPRDTSGDVDDKGKQESEIFSIYRHCPPVISSTESISESDISEQSVDLCFREEDKQGAGMFSLYRDKQVLVARFDYKHECNPVDPSLNVDSKHKEGVDDGTISEEEEGCSLSVCSAVALLPKEEHQHDDQQ